MTATANVERMIEYTEHLTNEARMCKNCRHFHQHYTIDGEEIYCGHCVYPRSKIRAPHDCCGYFESRYRFGAPQQKRKAPISGVALMSDFKWQLRALESRLDDPVSYAERLGENVPETIAHLKNWLLTHTDQATAEELKLLQNVLRERNPGERRAEQKLPFIGQPTFDISYSEVMKP